MNPAISENPDKPKLLDRIKTRKIKLINTYVPKMIRLLAAYMTRTNGRLVFENPDGFEDFGPVLLQGDDDKYSSKIKYGVDNPSIMNLALTGPLGSGKSTILRTFEHKYRQYSYLNISLATFDSAEFSPKEIENNILKQLFYSVEHKKIPESRFKRIENLKGIEFKTFLFVLWLCSVVHIFKVDLLDDLKKILHVDFYSGFLRVIYGLYFLGYTCVLVYKLMSFVLNFKLTKFKIKDVDFDNNQDKKTVSFESEIDEILYFFERNNVDVVYFQDLDRFKESSIFIKLREINSLINNYEPIKKERKITFIYAVCDDVFKQNDRAKFFDFIIPVIPVINYTSSSSKLLFKLREDIINKKLNKEFIDDVSLFLNDYRTIKSICNEYQIYKSILGGQLENYDNLLGMMIYKNLEPTDFERLNLNKGYVYNIFENSKELTAKTIENYKERTAAIKEEIEKTSRESLKDISELRMVYIQKFAELVMQSKNHAVHGFHLNHALVPLEEIIKEEFFEQLRKQSNIVYYYSQYSSQGSSISFTQIDKQVGREHYVKRCQTIQNKEKDNLGILKYQLQEIDYKRREISSKKFHEILDAENSAAYFQKHAETNKEINNFKLVNYLLSGGYIDEEYNHYVSHFHPGSITKEDNDFLQSLLPSQKPLSFSHKLKEFKSLVKRIKPENFGRQAILNHSLTEYLIVSGETGKLGQIAGLLSKGNTGSMEFVDELLESSSDEHKEVFFKILVGKWNGLWKYIITKSNFAPDKIQRYLNYAFSYLDLAEIENLDLSGELSKYISELEDFNFLYSCGNDQKLLEFLKTGAVKFKNLSYREEHKEAFDLIYTGSHYELNFKMIELFISDYYASQSYFMVLKTANYTTIKKSGKTALIKYVDENLDIYLENVLLKLENNTEESQENLCALLNNENLQQRSNLIAHGKFSIEDVSQISDSAIQESLLKDGKIKPLWKNVISYYRKAGSLSEPLLNFLNLKQNYSILANEEMLAGSKAEDLTIETFARELIKSQVSDASFADLARNHPIAYSDVSDFSQVSENKIKILISSKNIKLNGPNFLVIREKFRNLLIDLVEVNAAEFIKNVKNYIVGSSLILEILRSGKISDSQKLSVVENASDEVIIENSALLLKLGEFLTSNKISTISEYLLSVLIAVAESEERKAELAYLYFEFIGDDYLQTIIGKMEGFSNLLSGKYAKVGYSSANEHLAEKLKDKLLSSFKISEDQSYIDLYPLKAAEN